MSAALPKSDDGSGRSEEASARITMSGNVILMRVLHYSDAFGSRMAMERMQ